MLIILLTKRCGASSIVYGLHQIKALSSVISVASCFICVLLRCSFTMEALAGDHLINGEGGKVSFDNTLKGAKYVAVYFSAHWCPPCKSFTPQLARVYNKINAHGTLEGAFSKGVLIQVCHTRVH